MERLEQYDAFSLPIADIYYDAEFNCRGEFTLQSVEELAENIQQNGLQLPVVVQPISDVADNPPAGYRWRLVAGHRRFKAVTTFLKWTDIPATVRHGLTEREALLFNFNENLERKDLNILEEAQVLARLFPEGTSLRKAAKELKRDTRWVHARLRLLKLPEPVQIKVAAGTLSLVDVEVLSQLEEPEEQIQGAEEIAEAKERGERPSEANLSREFHYRKSKSQINKMIARLLECGIEGLAPRALSWAAGYIGDDELEQDISQHLDKQTSSFPADQVRDNHD